MANNQLATRKSPLGRLDPFGFFETPFAPTGLFSDYRYPDNKLMFRDVLEDGTTVLEYNLAGYTKEEIKGAVDTVAHQLIITAEKKDNESTRKARIVLSLPQYTSPEDVKMGYENGVLKLSIAPIEKRKEEALVELPFTE